MSDEMLQWLAKHHLEALEIVSGVAENGALPVSMHLRVRREDPTNPRYLTHPLLASARNFSAPEPVSPPTRSHTPEAGLPTKGGARKSTWAKLTSTGQRKHKGSKKTKLLSGHKSPMGHPTVEQEQAAAEAQAAALAQRLGEVVSEPEEESIKHLSTRLQGVRGYSVRASHIRAEIDAAHADLAKEWKGLAMRVGVAILKGKARRGEGEAKERGRLGRGTAGFVLVAICLATSPDTTGSRCYEPIGLGLPPLPYS